LERKVKDLEIKVKGLEHKIQEINATTNL